MSVYAPVVKLNPHNILTINAFESELGQTQLGVTSVTGDPITEESILAKTITFANGANSDAKQWFNETTYLDGFVARVTTHVKGPKDGAGIIPGELVKRDRKKNDVVGLSVIGIDVDSGESIPETRAKLKKLGKFAVLHTSHSHLKDSTVVLQTPLDQFIKKQRRPNTPDDRLANIKAYLQEMRGYLPRVIDGISLDSDEWTHMAGGLGVVVRHVPMPKFRIYFPLAEPFTISKQVVSQAESLKLWGRLIKGVCDGLNLHFDEACLDVTRMFYLPRHGVGSQFESHVIRGPLLKIEDITPAENVSAKRGGTGRTTPPADNRFSKAGVGKGGREDAPGSGDARSSDYRYTASGFDLWAWGKSHGKRLNLASLISAIAPGKIRSGEGNDQLEMECPFDGDHGNAGDESDRAFFVTNAQNEHGDWFGAYCNHNACQDHNANKLDFICAMINDETITVENITDTDYLLESDEEIALRALKDGIGSLTESTGKGGIDKVLEQLAALESVLPPKEFAGYLGDVESKTGMTKKAVTAALSKATKKVAEERKAAETEGAKERADEERLNQNAASVKGGASAANVRLNYKEDGHKKCVADAFARLRGVSKTEQNYFSMGGFKVWLHKPVDITKGVEVMQLDRDLMLRQLNKHVDWLESVKGSPLVSCDCPYGVARDILVDPELAFTPLDRFAAVPTFTKTGELVQTPGYDVESRIFYQPPHGFVLEPISEKPTPEEVKEAATLLEELFYDFPFDDGDDEAGRRRGGDSSRAHNLAYLLIGFMRDMIDGSVPIHFISKPKAGTGASKLLTTITTIVEGKPAAVQAETGSDEEQSKAMTAFLIGGSTYHIVDNIHRKIAGAAYALITTADTWKGRVLGESRMVEMLVRCIFAVAGNNLEASEEIARRCLPILLDARMSDPTKGREEFKHPMLEEWVAAHRARLVHAALTLIQSWVANGKQAWTGEPMASYESYSRVMGGILANAGVRGFLGNLDAVREAASPDRDAKQAFITLMWDKRGDAMLPVRAPFKAGSGFDGEDSLVALAEEAGLDVGFNNFDEDLQKVNKLGTYLGKYMKKDVFSIKDATRGWIDVRVTSKAATHTLWGLTEVVRAPVKSWRDWLQESAYYTVPVGAFSI